MIGVMGGSQMGEVRSWQGIRSSEPSRLGVGKGYEALGHQRQGPATVTACLDMGPWTWDWILCKLHRLQTRKVGPNKWQV